MLSYNCNGLQIWATFNTNCLRDFSFELESFEGKSPLAYFPNLSSAHVTVESHHCELAALGLGWISGLVASLEQTSNFEKAE